MLPLSAPTEKARTAPAARLAMLTRATEAMLASASPRKPSERTCSRSSSEAILLVACRANAIGRSPLSMPAPLSATRIRLIPPSASATPISVAPASRLFSRSSLRTDAGRSTTSPAAIWLMSVSGKGRIEGTGGGLFSPGMTGALRPCRFRRGIYLSVAVECRGGTPSLRLGPARPSRPAPRGTASATRRLGLSAAFRRHFLRNRAGRDAFSPRGLAVVRRRGACSRGRHRRAPARSSARRGGGARQYRQLLDRVLPRAEGLPLGAVPVLQQESARTHPRLLRTARRQDHRNHALCADFEDLRALRRRDCAHDLCALHRVQPGRRARVGAVAPLRRVLVRQCALRQAEPAVGHPRHHRVVADSARV